MYINKQKTVVGLTDRNKPTSKQKSLKNSCTNAIKKLPFLAVIKAVY